MLIEMKVYGLTMDPYTNAPIVILKDSDNNNTLPIWIGILEASAIATELEDIHPTRPMTHDLLKNILGKVCVNVSRIVVTDLKDNVYYASIYMSRGKEEHAIDARPSDAIAVALRTDSPIFVDEQVFDKSKRMFFEENKSVGTNESKKWEEILETLSPEDFGKYKM
ncbi:MAG: bifunctional nuclease family protein [Deltaproteobacteria bacterium]|nr:bifunctional nuclease family protein [Deltaproteobacteria bacterium]